MRYKAAIERVGSTPMLVITCIIFIIIQISFQLILVPPFLEASGGVGIPDMAMAYTPERLYEVLTVMEGDALSWYKRIQVVDFIYPLVYSGLFAGILFRIYKRKYDSFSSYRWIVTMPFVGAFCDYTENIGFRILINLMPKQLNSVGWVLSVFSTIKFLIIGFSILMVLTGIIYFVNGRRNSRFAKD